MLHSCTSDAAVANSLSTSTTVWKTGFGACPAKVRSIRSGMLTASEQRLKLGLRLGANCSQVHSRAYVGQDAHRMFPMIDLCNHSQHAANVEG